MKWMWPSVLSSENRASVSEDSGVPSIWIFGYGSLIWKPGFEFVESRRTTLKGFRRGFWQGNSTHRGTQSMPGRVVTITPCVRSSVTGLAFRVEGLDAIAAALTHLQAREIDAGYVYQTVHLHTTNSHKATLSALTVVAKEDNPDWLGTADEDQDIGAQIAVARGPAGPNTEYLFNLTAALRRLFPDTHEPHLFAVEAAVHSQLAMDQLE